MSNRKNQNSILVLATLGVYLGLVLAGATPVLASAAMTRTFDVKDEIEFKDDLDTKPDDERSPVTASVQIYIEDVEYFLASLGRLRSKGKFDTRVDSFSVAQNTLLPCVDSSIAGRYTPIRFDSSNDASRPALEYFTKATVYGYSLGDCLQNNEFDGVAAVDSRIAFELGKDAFAVKIATRKQTPHRALELLGQLRSTLKLYSALPNNKLRKSIIDRTTFRAENDQVFVITSLPRGSLDSLTSNKL